MGPAREPLQPLQSHLARPGLAKDLLPHRADLIGADHQGSRSPTGDRQRLLPRQGGRKLLGGERAALEGILVHPGSLALEGNPEALQEGAAIAGRGGEDERGRVHPVGADPPDARSVGTARAMLPLSEGAWRRASSRSERGPLHTPPPGVGGASSPRRPRHRCRRLQEPDCARHRRSGLHLHGR